MTSLANQVFKNIIDERVNHLMRDDSFECIIKMADGELIVGQGNTRFDSKSNATQVAIEYALSKGWISPVSELFSFSVALDFIKQGKRVARQGWNGADQWLSISCPESKEIPADAFWSKHNAEFARSNGGYAIVAPCITLKNAQGQIVMGWTPSAGDLFANDWIDVDLITK